MAMPSQTGKPSPERIFSTLNAYQQSEALKAAINVQRKLPEEDDPRSHLLFSSLVASALIYTSFPLDFTFTI
jgi:hypothetical protein